MPLGLRRSFEPTRSHILVIHTSQARNLPLRLLPRLELLQDSHLLLQRRQPNPQLQLPSLLIVRQLLVEVVPVGRSRHGGREDRLHEKVMVGFERRGVRRPERRRELLGRLLDVLS